jgi:hypothetical protein
VMPMGILGVLGDKWDTASNGWTLSDYGLQAFPARSAE